MYDLGDDIFVAFNDILAIIDLTTVKDSRDTRDFLRSAYHTEPDLDKFRTAIIMYGKDGQTKAMFSSASVGAIKSRLAQTDVNNFI